MSVIHLKFLGYSGYLISSKDTPDQLLTIRHSASVAPWADADVHAHERAEELYFLVEGRLKLLVADTQITLNDGELLLVKPQVAHAVVGGEGPIEHFLIRCPASQDRNSLSLLPDELPETTLENPRQLIEAWGYRIPLEAEGNQNCWLLGIGSARFRSDMLGLAYLRFDDQEEANAGLGVRHRPHFHRHSWEYYVVLEGTKTLEIDGELLALNAGEMAIVPAGVPHTLIGRQAPFRGFTMRAPLLDDKVSF
jgi:mannose-6-phosphate isomerase-like protein (cupin superfamily)